MKPLFVGNWKLYKTPEEAAAMVIELSKRLPAHMNADIAIAPPYIDIPAVVAALKDSPVLIDVSAQNVFWEKEGAYTGEVSASMLVAAGCKYVIIGHSERRQYFGETDEILLKKLTIAITAGLIPILCVGETQAERDAGETFLVLDKQLVNGLKDLSSTFISDLVLAYEPVWAIGTGRTATSEQAQEVHVFIRKRMAEIYNSAFAQNIRILYGGSVKSENIVELMSMPDINGVLVGGASLTATSFSEIIAQGV